MRSNLPFAPAAWTAIAFFVLTGCLKPHDLEILHDEGFKFCPIQQLNITNAGATTIDGVTLNPVINITYNAAGNPTDMLASGNYGIFQEDYHFRYDKFNRLTDYYDNATFSTGAFTWHRYCYRDHWTIVDTTYDYVGNINSPEPPHSSFDTHLDIYKLDDLGRIIKDIPVNAFDGTVGEPINYTYDDKGDLIISGVTYDDKINPFQTNNVWSFIYKNYSLHNPSQSILQGDSLAYPSYNSLGLPLEIDAPRIGYLFGDPYTTMKIKYACDAGQKK